MAIQAGKGGEMQIVLRVKDDGTAVIEKFGKIAEREGEKTSESWNKIGKSVGLVAAVAAATAAVMVKSAIDTADATGKAADKLGMTTESFSALAYAAKTTADITRDNFGQAMRMMVDNLSQAAQGTGLAKNAIADLGLNASQLAKMGPEKAIMAISDAMEKIPNQGDRVRIAMDVFRNSDMVNALRGGSAAMHEMMDQAKRTGQVIGDDFARNADAFNDNVDLLKSSATGLANTLVSVILPSVNAILERFNVATGALGSLSVDLLKKDREFLLVEFNAITKAADQGMIVNSARAEVLRKQIEEIDTQIAEANKNAANQPAGKGGQGSGGTGLPGIQKVEELTKRIAEIRAATLSEEQRMAESYVKSYLDLNAARAAGVITSDEELARRRIEIADSYEQQSTDRQYKEIAQNLAGIAANMETLEESFLTENELEMARYEQKLLDLENYKLSELFVQETYNTRMADLIAQHEKKIGDIKVAEHAKQYGQQNAWMQQTANLMQGNFNQQVQGTGAMLGQVANLMQSGSKKQFEIGKKAAIAQALVNTYLAVASGLATTPFFPLGIIMGAAALAVGISNVNRIRSQQFQGGGAGGGSVPTFSANPNTGLPTGTPGGDGGLPSSQLPPPPTSAVPVQRVTNVNIESDSGLVSLEWVRTKLGPTLAQAQRDGGLVSIT